MFPREYRKLPEVGTLLMVRDSVHLYQAYGDFIESDEPLPKGEIFVLLGLPVNKLRTGRSNALPYAECLTPRGIRFVSLNDIRSPWKSCVLVDRYTSRDGVNRFLRPYWGAW